MLGTACQTEGQRCGTISCFCDPIAIDPGIVCMDGYWTIIGGGC